MANEDFAEQLARVWDALKSAGYSETVRLFTSQHSAVVRITGRGLRPLIGAWSEQDQVLSIYGTLEVAQWLNGRTHATNALEFTNLINGITNGI